MARSLILPSLLLLSIFACKKPPLDELVADSPPPLVNGISLADTLPANILAELQPIEKQGVQVRSWPANTDVRYFEYQANRNIVLNAIAKLPFAIHAPNADTICRPIAVADFDVALQHISADEIAAAPFFYQIEASDYEIFECIKGFRHHTLLIHKENGTILHRIES